MKAQSSWGTVNDVRVYGDFDGDGKLDYAVFRPSTGTWNVHLFANPTVLISVQFGLPGDIPVPADYTGDGLTDYAVWRPSNGTWYILPSTGTASNPGPAIITPFGLPGDIPVTGVYDAAQCVTPGVPVGCLTHPKASLAVWRPSNQTWYITPNNSGLPSYATQWGLVGDIPLAGDWDGDGKQDLAVWRPSNGTYYIIPSATPGTPIQKQWGIPGDVPVTASFDLATKTSYGVQRSTESNMYLTLASDPTLPVVQQWGPPSGGPATNIVKNQLSLCTVGKNIYVRVEGDFDGDKQPDFAFWRPRDGIWYIVPSGNPTQSFEQQWGVPGDVPVAADYDGDGRTDIAVWRPSNGTFYILPSNGPAPSFVNTAGQYTVQWGLPKDIPQLGDFNADGKADFAVWRPSNGTWYVAMSTGTGGGATVSQQWGLQGDVPVVGDFDGDKKTDYAVWRPSNGTWYVIQSSTATPVATQWGLLGDLPVAADFDGDGKSDLAVFRTSSASWLIAPSNGGAQLTIPLGIAANEVMYAQPPLTTAFILPDVREDFESTFTGAATPGAPVACEAH